MNKITLICSCCKSVKIFDDEGLLYPVCDNKECPACGVLTMEEKCFEGHYPWACSYCKHVKKALKNKNCERYNKLKEGCGER